MSFLDSLENNLKALESREQEGMGDARKREADQTQAKAAAPWADRLKRDPWTQTLMQQMTRAGFERRTKVNLAWIGSTLRMEARGHRLELRPSPQGVAAVFLHGTEESKQEPVNFSADPRRLVADWMTVI
ncbi:MAG TPA: hypothetical protein VHB50_09400, partial [Bryobacteraceae bacterium]|nr:hypothetical protein [Bryobacteraceae bacterium]